MSIIKDVISAFTFSDKDEYEDDAYSRKTEDVYSGQSYTDGGSYDRFRGAAGKSGKRYSGMEEEKYERRRKSPDREDNVISLNKDEERTVANMHLMQYDDVYRVTAQLKQSRIIFVDLSQMDKLEAQRVLDFICGLCEGVNAEIQRATESGYVFIITPNGVNVISDDRSEAKGKGMFQWTK